MLLCAVAIVLAHSVLAVQGGNLFQKTRPADDIEALCANKPVALLAVSELEHLNSIVSSSRCSDNVKAAISDLVTLIAQTRNNMCAKESTDNLRTFYLKHLDTSAEANKNREQLPKSLRKFALAYGMQMSSNCKRRMVHVLTNQGRDILYTEAHDAVRNLVSDKSPLADMLEGLAGPDEILLPGDLAPYIKDKQQEDDTIYVQSATGPYIRDMQANCNQVFAPLYRPLIKPLVQLVNMGFNYKDEPLRCKMDCSETASQLAKWSRLVFLCESLNNVRMVDVSEQLTDTAESDAEGKTVRILTREEAVALDDKSASEPQVVEIVDVPVIWYDDLIFNKEDKKLKRAIKTFSTSKSEDEKIAKRMMGKGVSMLKTQLKRYNIGLLFSKGYKALVHRIRTGEKFKPNEEIVETLDAAIGHENEFKDSRPKTKWDISGYILGAVGRILEGVILCILFLAIGVLLGSLYIVMVMSGISMKQVIKPNFELA